MWTAVSSSTRSRCIHNAMTKIASKSGNKISKSSRKIQFLSFKKSSSQTAAAAGKESVPLVGRRSRSAYRVIHNGNRGFYSEIGNMVQYGVAAFHTGPEMNIARGWDCSNDDDGG